MSAPITLAKVGSGHLAPFDGQARAALAKWGEGEMLVAEIRRPRNPAFHRKAFALLQFAYGQWNPAGRSIEGMPAKKDFDVFRKELTIQAGFYEVVLGLDGQARLEAQSLSYGAMDDEKFERWYNAVFEVLTDTILPGLSRDQAERMAEAIFEEGF
jgi:hypothetical protein